MLVCNHVHNPTITAMYAHAHAHRNTHVQTYTNIHTGTHTETHTHTHTHIYTHLYHQLYSSSRTQLLWLYAWTIQISPFVTTLAMWLYLVKGEVIYYIYTDLQTIYWYCNHNKTQINHILCSHFYENFFLQIIIFSINNKYNKYCVCVSVHAHAHVHAHVHACTSACASTHACACTCVHVCMYIYMCMCICMCANISEYTLLQILIQREVKVGCCDVEHVWHGGDDDAEVLWRCYCVVTGGCAKMTVVRLPGLMLLC